MGTPDWTAGKLVSFDTETDGPEPETAHIVTASVVIIDGTTGQVDTHEWLVAVEDDIPAEATAVHGISTEYARAHGRDPRDVVAEVCRLLADELEDGVPRRSVRPLWRPDLRAGRARVDRGCPLRGAGRVEDRASASGVRGLGRAQDKQAAWHREWADHFGAYLTRQGKADDVCRAWPLRELSDDAVAAVTGDLREARQ